MFNISPTRAIGGTLSAGFVAGGARLALEARRRVWLSDGSTFDLSSGVTRTPVPFSAAVHYGAVGYGLTTGAYMGSGDIVHINAHGDLLFANGRARARGTIGIGGGSYAAVTATGVLAALATALLITLAHSNLN